MFQWFISIARIAMLTSCMMVASVAGAQPNPPAAEVTLLGSLFCNGGCIAEPKAEDHVMVLITEKGYAGQEFRVIVEDASDSKK